MVDGDGRVPLAHRADLRSLVAGLLVVHRSKAFVNFGIDSHAGSRLGVLEGAVSSLNRGVLVGIVTPTLNLHFGIWLHSPQSFFENLKPLFLNARPLVLLVVSPYRIPVFPLGGFEVVEKVGYFLVR